MPFRKGSEVQPLGKVEIGGKNMFLVSSSMIVGLICGWIYCELIVFFIRYSNLSSSSGYEKKIWKASADWWVLFWLWRYSNAVITLNGRRDSVILEESK